MARAEWNGATLVDSDDVEVVEGNLYFPGSAVKAEHLRPSTKHTTCPWKGEASYYDVVVGDSVNEDAAWTYLQPMPAAKQIQGRIAFWRGVKVSRD